MAVSFKGAHGPKDIILMGVRWYVASPLSTRQVEALLLELGVHVAHATINRWVSKYSPQLEEAFQRRKRLVWISWRRDGTSIRVKGEWRYLYRAVDKYGQTIDFLLTEHRDKEAAFRVSVFYNISYRYRSSKIQHGGSPTVTHEPGLSTAYENHEAIFRRVSYPLCDTDCHVQTLPCSRHMQRGFERR